MTSSGDVCVVHLARHANGWLAFDRFMQSYEEHPAGLDHQLVVALKGFPDGDAPPEITRRLRAHGAESLLLEDVGFDLGSYRESARALDSARLCFLNSFSVILADGWLAALAMTPEPFTGLAGASGSWEARPGTDRATLWSGLLLPPWRSAPEPHPSRRLGARDRAWLTREWVRRRRQYPPFPDPHLRTNAFVIDRDLFLDIDPGPLVTKEDTLRFESGRRSLTREVLRRGLPVVVVGRDGVAYPPERWPESKTFRSGEQANLLVADRRTEEWARLPAAEKQQLAELAWGPSTADGDAVRGSPGGP